MEPLGSGFRVQGLGSQWPSWEEHWINYHLAIFHRVFSPVQLTLGAQGLTIVKEILPIYVENLCGPNPNPKP